MKILMVYELGPMPSGKCLGGLEIHILNLSKELVKLGCRVTWLTGAIPKAPNIEFYKGIKIVRIDFLNLISKSWNPFNLTFNRQLSFLLSTPKMLSLARESDVIHGHLYSSSLISLALSKLFNKPSVCTIHGSYFFHWRKLEENMVKAYFFKGLECFLIPFLGRLCDLQIHTDTLFASVARKLGVPSSKIRVFLNGVDTTIFSPNTIPTIKTSCFTILTHRRLVRKNGVHILIKALSLLPKNMRIKLLIIGDGPEKPCLIKLAKELKVSDKIIFLGWKPNEEIPGYLAAADLIVIPSIVEASSISMLEAMAMSKPVIASNIPGIRDIVGNERCAILVPPENPEELASAILFLYDNPKLRMELSFKARKLVVKNHSWKAIAKRMLNEYLSLLS